MFKRPMLTPSQSLIAAGRSKKRNSFLRKPKDAKLMLRSSLNRTRFRTKSMRSPMITNRINAVLSK